MKLHRLFLIAVLTGTFALLGCGDDDGQSASQVCDACDNQNLKGACESAYNNCINIDRGGSEECVAIGLAACGI